MIGKCGVCGFGAGILNLTNGLCKSCLGKGEKTMSGNEGVTNSVANTEKGFFGKLSNGDFGLAKTYWLYGVLVGFVVNVASNLITSIGLLVIVILAYTAYEIPVIIGTWRAANKYEGSKIWAVLAKIAVVLGAIMLVIGLVAVVGLFGGQA